jgi:hypothetical protein
MKVVGPLLSSGSYQFSLKPVQWFYKLLGVVHTDTMIRKLTVSFKIRQAKICPSPPVLKLKANDVLVMIFGFKEGNSTVPIYMA